MDKECERRINSIRERVRAERMIVETLSDQLTDLKQLVKPCHTYLNDVIFFYLDQTTLIEKAQAAPGVLTRWLDKTETMISRAIEQRRYVEAIVQRYGNNARIVRAD